LGWFVIRISRPRLRVLMLCNPLNRVIFRNKALDYFRFAIGPQNIDPPARTGIFPRHESWSLLGHPSNMRLRLHDSRQLSCHNHPRGSGICGRHVPAARCSAGLAGCDRPAHSVRPIGFRRNHFSEATKSARNEPRLAMAEIKQQGSIMLASILNVFYRQACGQYLTAMRRRRWA
jgi:hypothetical protein